MIPKVLNRLGLSVVMIGLGLSASNAIGREAGWQRHEVDWRMNSGTRIKAIHSPQALTPDMLAVSDGRRTSHVTTKVLPPEAAARLASFAGEAAAATGGTIYANLVDSPPIGGFVPYIAVTVTDSHGEELELDAIPRGFVLGGFLTPNPETDYAIGLLDTGASVSLMGFDPATRIGLFSGNPDFVTSSTIEITGVTGSIDAWVSMPLGLFIDGLGAINPDTLDLNYSDMMGETNLSILAGQAYAPPQSDLPTAIGAPMSVYFATHVNNEVYHQIVRDDETYIAPDIEFFWPEDPQVPSYPNLVPLELRPHGALSVQYIPCIDLFGGCPEGFVPQSPSTITGTATQSLFFIGSGVDLTDNGHSAIDKDRFMVDTGAQVTVVGYRVGARLALDPAAPDFLAEIQGVTGDVTYEPGFYIDTLDIPALGEWLSYTNVPVVLLDVGSPEGGTLDGIIGMNLFVDYNFVLRGGGIFGSDAPSLEFQLAAPGLDVDYDDDGDVDQADFGHLQACFSGPDVPQTDPGCADTLLDADEDVDQDDFAALQACLSGPNAPAIPSCTDQAP